MRTIENCTIAARVYSRYDPDKYEDGMCSGVRNDGDEPIEECKKCRWLYTNKEGEK